MANQGLALNASTFFDQVPLNKQISRAPSICSRTNTVTSRLTERLKSSSFNNLSPHQAQSLLQKINLRHPEKLKELIKKTKKSPSFQSFISQQQSRLSSPRKEDGNKIQSGSLVPQPLQFTNNAKSKEFMSNLNKLSKQKSMSAIFQMMHGRQRLKEEIPTVEKPMQQNAEKDNISVLQESVNNERFAYRPLASLNSLIDGNQNKLKIWDKKPQVNEQEDEDFEDEDQEVDGLDYDEDLQDQDEQDQDQSPPKVEIPPEIKEIPKPVENNQNVQLGQTNLLKILNLLQQQQATQNLSQNQPLNNWNTPVFKNQQDQPIQQPPLNLLQSLFSVNPFFQQAPQQQPMNLLQQTILQSNQLQQQQNMPRMSEHNTPTLVPPQDLKFEDRPIQILNNNLLPMAAINVSQNQPSQLRTDQKQNPN